ncbi:hypothetical protein CLF_105694 [Clonorchis sinensis]|uniref:Uncharacterized protein n=1 Tax=Clonorchis sinensis TaxID=79923 RepID=G7YE02_CLOSI|nr:hypothetical protein CLF_105694 [Clonorchis sinensis]
MAILPYLCTVPGVLPVAQRYEIPSGTAYQTEQWHCSNIGMFSTVPNIIYLDELSRFPLSISGDGEADAAGFRDGIVKVDGAIKRVTVIRDCFTPYWPPRARCTYQLEQSTLAYSTELLKQRVYSYSPEVRQFV